MSFDINNGYLHYIEENDETEVTIPEEALAIVFDAFKDCQYLKKVTFPKTISIGDGAFRNCISLETLVFEEKPKFQTVGFGAPRPFQNCPKLRLTADQIKQSGSISNAFSCLDTAYTDEELAWLCLYQGNKDWVKRVDSQITDKNASYVLKEIIKVINQSKKITKTVGGRAVAFALDHFQEVEKQDVSALAEVLEKKCKESAKVLKEDPRLQTEDVISKDSELEAFCLKKYMEMDGDKLFAEYKITGFQWPNIKYTDGTDAPIIVLKYLVARYANQYANDWSVHLFPEADKVAESLDHESLNDAMLYILENAPIRAHRILYYSICRFINPDHYIEVLKNNNKHSQEEASFKAASLLCFSSSAVNFLSKQRQLLRYTEDPEILAFAAKFFSKSQKKKLLDYALENKMTEITAILLDSSKH